MDLNGPLLQMRGVGFRYPGAGVAALDGVTLTVTAGEGIALLGSNGAGKTTLLRAAMALVHPDAGSVHVAGMSTSGHAPEDLAGVAGYLFQHPESQLFERTVRDEAAFGPVQLGWEADRVDASVREVLEELELTAVASLHPYDLPVPRRRLVALAATLAAAPRLLLLDEPTAGLDQAGRKIVARVVRARREHGCAALAVTHDGEFALEALDSAVILERGRVAADGPLSTLLGSTPDVPALPPYAQLGGQLGLRLPSLRQAAVAAALAAHCRPGG